MTIKKFDDFINEDVKIPVLDILIDYNGNLYNGKVEKYPLRKGNIVQKKISAGTGIFNDKGVEKRSNKNTLVDIIGVDAGSYPAGIDKNGVLVAVNKDEDGYVTKKLGDDYVRIPIPNQVVNLYRSELNGLTYWKTDVDYSFLVPILPTGWVNVKIDMEVLKKVRRYSKSLGSETNNVHNSFISKLEDIQRISNRDLRFSKKSGEVLASSFNKKRETIQKEMSVIILLHHINEIKDFFTPGSSGFLFESFLAGFIPNSKVVEDNGVADVTANGVSYQMKLYGYLSSTIPVTVNDAIDYYIVGIKHPQKIDIYVIDRDTVPAVQISSGFSMSRMTSNTNIKKFSFELLNIEQRIASIARGLKESLDFLYAQLSEFQYNIETIITGVDENGDLVSDNDDFDKYKSRAIYNVENMSRELDKLVKSVKVEKKI
jgi:hypothetical protein